MNELTASEASRRIARRELAPTAYLEAILARIDLVDNEVRAWSYLDRDGAREQAAALEAEAMAGHLRGPLHGVPVGVKDQFAVRGMPDADPRSPIEDRALAEDAVAVSRLRASGAIILGKTFMAGAAAPPTRNPWNLTHTPGGSSSGSGAAVAARMVPIALAEQSGGSCLRPAAYCGVSGFKPTFGRVSRKGMFPLTYSQDHVGIIGLSIEDIALAFSVLAVGNSGHELPDEATSHPDLRAPRVGVVRNVIPDLTEPSMRSALDEAERRIAHSGAVIRDVLLPRQFGLTWLTNRLIYGAEGATIFARQDAARAVATGTWASFETAPHVRPLTFDAEGFAARSLRALIPTSYYLQAQRIRRLLVEVMVDFYKRENIDVLLMPSTPGPAPSGLSDTGDAVLLMPWSHLGFPAVNVQSGQFSPGQLPLGLQLVAPPGADLALLAAGMWAERALGMFSAPSLG